VYDQTEKRNKKVQRREEEEKNVSIIQKKCLKRGKISTLLAFS